MRGSVAVLCSVATGGVAWGRHLEPPPTAWKPQPAADPELKPLALPAMVLYRTVGEITLPTLGVAGLCVRQCCDEEANDQLGSTAGRGGVLHRMPVCCWKLNQGGAPMHAANGKFDAVVAGKGATVTGGVDACHVGDGQRAGGVAALTAEPATEAEAGRSAASAGRGAGQDSTRVVFAIRGGEEVLPDGCQNDDDDRTNGTPP